MHAVVLEGLVWVGDFVNFLPVQVAQWINALTSGIVGRMWAAGRQFESHVHHENAFQSKVNLLLIVSRIWQILLSLGPQKVEPRVGDTSTRISGPDLNIPSL